ncbi:MAG: hypothetical protein JNJ61_28900 [Anaerolineae bacterium]|nr:hypothetical protein [Anaerolineae bacterium]
MARYRRFGMGWIVGIGLLLVIAMPLAAQDGGSSAPPLFATNTPPPSAFAPPDAPIDRYALRLWDERTLSNLLLSQVRALRLRDGERQLAIQLLQNELRRRFPSAPSGLDARLELLNAMLLAPRGSVDMRPVVRPYIEYILNQEQPSFGSNLTFDHEGFTLRLTPLQLDNDSRADALIHIQYPTGDDPSPLYVDYVLARVDEAGIYRVLAAPESPAAPFDNIRSVTLERLGDLNSDGLDEVALSVERSDAINRELLIYGYRGGAAVSLVQPGERLLYGEISDWPLSGTTLSVREYRVESAAWQCYGERDVTWSWVSNFYRRPTTQGNFSFQNRLGCLLYGAEPIFAMPVNEAIGTIEELLPLAEPEDAYSAQRANMMLAVLRVLNADISSALEEVNALADQAEPGSWLAGQTSTFQDAANESGMTPLKLCARIEQADEYGACDVNQLLARLFVEQPLRRDEPIEAQVSRLGLSILDQVTLTAVGRLDREAVRFDLGGDDWWAFAPLGRETYTAEKISAPPGYESADAPTLLLVPSPAALNALLAANDPEAALNALETLATRNPGVPLASSAQYMRALSYDLLGDRTAARRAYYELWSDAASSVWGQLAAAHLERR